ncbi:MAG TPA: trypsin-like peptidase domain-containing protein [Gemmatimonadales bacterium]|jgi:S1-C subfamily serine protease/pSer/pThr/pTyr-binding forkhead associated (FHA) protein|nr:trypsin-like peptidase domain-containing protein [Gemmatimonadales bacterium]
MKAQFRFLSGSRAGQTDIFSQPYIAIGRHPECHLRFDPDQDLDVSARHAAVTRTGELYVLRDLGSTNGTWVNGRRLTGDHVLASRDRIRFGPNGPQVEFTAIPEPRPGPQPLSEAGLQPAGTVVFGGPGPTGPAIPPRPPSPESPKPPRRTPGPGSTTRVKLEVARQTRGLRRTTIILFGLLLLSLAAYLWQARDAARRLAAQREALLAVVDSLVTEIGALSSGSEGLRAALDSARADAQALRRQLAQAPNDAGAIAELRRRLDAAVRLQQSLASAARLDAPFIARQNREAVGLVFVQHRNQKVFTGTGFAVRVDSQGGFVVTNQHVVVDSLTGTAAEKIGIVFEGSNQNFRAEIAKLHPSADLALLRVEVRGLTPVRGLAPRDRRPSVGEPVATIGFPLGLDLAAGADWRRLGVAATLTLGTVTRVVPDLLQLDSYGAPGSSGSPVLDRDGRVLGVLYGGQPGSQGRIVYAVPVGRVYELLGE